MEDSAAAARAYENFQAATDSMYNRPASLPDSGSHINIDALLNESPVFIRRAMTPHRPVQEMVGPAATSEDRRRRLLERIERSFQEVPEPRQTSLEASQARRPLRHLHFVHSPDTLDGRSLSKNTHEKLSWWWLDKYLDSYWKKFHPQVPLMHMASFNVDNTHDLLLLTMIAIGASMLDENRGNEVANEAADLARFLAWNIRTQLQNHPDYRCPTRLWVLQALCLLESFEKAFSDRTLHERSQIHHASTITLLRRGDGLIDTNCGSNEDDDDNFGVGEQSTQCRWRAFIHNESKKRVALAVFITDAMHAAMFCHPASLPFWEVELTLPCSDLLWQCGSAADYAETLRELEEQNNAQSITFQTALQGTLSGDSTRTKIHTSMFGRMAILAGMLSLRCEQSRQMKAQKEESWYRGLSQWRNHASPMLPAEMDLIFESCVLYHLAQVTSRVSVVILQRFARVDRIMGRKIRASGRTEAQQRMRLWAAHNKARVAVWHAMRFLIEVFKQPDWNLLANPGTLNGLSYRPREDYLLNRPWVVYVSSLTIWAYGYTVEGPLRAEDVPTLDVHEQKVEDAQAFLQRMSTVTAPEQLLGMRGRNRCMGLLMLLSEKFKECRWELLRESSDCLENCIDMLRGLKTPVDSSSWLPLQEVSEEQERRHAATQLKQSIARMEERTADERAKLKTLEEGRAMPRAEAGRSEVYM